MKLNILQSNANIQPKKADATPGPVSMCKSHSVSKLSGKMALK